jgi:hypothetical protein
MFGLFIYFASIFFGLRGKFIRVLWIPTLLISFSLGFRTEIYFYAFAFYFAPLLLMLGLFYCLQQSIRTNDLVLNWKLIALTGLTSFLAAGWLEHFAVAIIGVLLTVYWVTSRAQRTVRMAVFASGITAAIAFAFLMLSPGLYAHRKLLPSNKSFFETVQKNTNFIVSEIGIGNSAVLLSALVLGFFFHSLNTKQRAKRWYLGLNLTAIGLMIPVTLSYLVYKVEGGTQIVTTILGAYTAGHLTIESHNLALQVVLLFSIMVACLGPLWDITRSTLWSGVYISFGVAGTLPILVSPNFGNRIVAIFSFALLLLALSYLGRLTWEHQTSWAGRLQKVFVSLFMLGLLGFGLVSTAEARKRIEHVQENRVLAFNKTRERQRQNLWGEQEVLKIPAFRNTDLYVEGSPGSLTPHYPEFLKYYGLDVTTKVEYYFLTFKN